MKKNKKSKKSTLLYVLAESLGIIEKLSKTALRFTLRFYFTFYVFI